MAEPNIQTMSNFSVANILNAGHHLHLDDDFIVAVPEMLHDCETGELLRVAKRVAKRLERRGTEGLDIEMNGFMKTGYTAAREFIGTDHRRNYAALLLMYKLGAFDDRWKLAQILSRQDPINLKYIKDLQTKYGSFGPGSPVTINGNGYTLENEKHLVLKCISNTDFECDRTFMENFLRHVALGAAVRRAETMEAQKKQAMEALRNVQATSTNLEAAVGQLEQRNELLEDEQMQWANDHIALTVENDELRDVIAELEYQNTVLGVTNAEFIAELAAVEDDNADWQQDNNVLEHKNSKLEAEVAKVKKNMDAIKRSFSILMGGNPKFNVDIMRINQKKADRRRIEQMKQEVRRERIKKKIEMTHKRVKDNLRIEASRRRVKTCRPLARIRKIKQKRQRERTANLVAARLRCHASCSAVHLHSMRVPGAKHLLERKD